MIINKINLNIFRYFSWNALLLFTTLLTACGGSDSNSETVMPITPEVPTSSISETSDFEQNSYNDNFNSTHFSGSANCAICHDSISDNKGNDLSIVKDWAASMMANSAKDPLWKAKVNSEMNRNPDLKEVIADKCTRCHMPMASTESHFNNDKIALFENGYLDPNHKLHNEAMDGVSCTLCHQVAENETFATEEGMSGHFAINEQREIYGQYSGVLTRPMQNNVNYTPTFSKHVSTSALCASCHNLKTPYVDITNGELVTDKMFPEQMPYGEWQESDFSDNGVTPSTCQDCHMPKVINSAVKIANRPNGVTPRDQFSQHLFLGANTYMLDILKGNPEKLNTSGVNFDNMIAKNREFITTAGDVNILASNIINDRLTFDVQVKNTIAHKLPTAYPSRRAYLHVVIKNDADVIIFESGKTQDNGAIVDNDADIDRNTYEPHYQLITSAQQVQIYETIMGNTKNNVTYTLLESAQYLKDNRVLPKGFDKYTVPDDVGVYGLAKTDDNFTQGQDSLRYQIDVSQFNSNYFTIDINFNYQPVAYSFLQDLFTDESTAVERFKAYNDSATIKYETIATLSTRVDR